MEAISVAINKDYTKKRKTIKKTAYFSVIVTSAAVVQLIHVQQHFAFKKHNLIKLLYNMTKLESQTMLT